MKKNKKEETHSSRKTEKKINWEYEKMKNMKNEKRGLKGVHLRDGQKKNDFLTRNVVRTREAIEAPKKQQIVSTHKEKKRRKNMNAKTPQMGLS